MIKPLNVSIRKRAFVGLVFSTLPLVLALIFQWLNALEPCHLCIFQRVAYMGCALVFLSALCFNPTSNWARYTHSVLVSISSLIGVALAGRQIWLQHLPEEEVPSCGASLEFMMDVLPLKEVIARVLRGTGECAEVDWTLIGLSMAQWSAISLCAILVCAVWISFPKSVVRD